MANLYGTPATCSSSYSPPETTDDDISLFLQQILLKSSSSSSYSSPPIVTKQTQCETAPLKPVYSSGLSGPDRIHTVSSYVETINNDIDQYDHESGGFENLMEQMAANSDYSRNGSKRARASDVHNLSEKRRRSRINEKMKALQKLIPNSNKTDKASMLDEAIEYLKQLQLRVQMLTMRNGMNLYSGVLQPEQLHHSRIGLHELSHIPIQCTNRNPLSIPDLSHVINPGSSCCLRESLIDSSGSEGVHLVNSQQKLVLPADLFGNCNINESYDDAKR